MIACSGIVTGPHPCQTLLSPSGPSTQARCTSYVVHRLPMVLILASTVFVRVVASVLTPEWDGHLNGMHEFAEPSRALASECSGHVQAYRASRI